MNNIARVMFYTGIIGISMFEIANVFFVMPMPGSQEMRSINLAYFLYTHRWHFRIFFALLIVIGIMNAFSIRHKWLPATLLIIAAAIIYFFNFKMTAENIFRQARNVIFKPMAENTLNVSSNVIGVENNGVVKAYPIQFLAYHHQVQDTVGGKPMMITYCSVCRSGRVYEPNINGRLEKFRLVGMDHYNAMFEDETTKSWWRQATGEAITGPLKGQQLPELASMQLTIRKLFELYPNALVMQIDEASRMRYDSLRRFEQGLSTNKLTRTDSMPWKNKSWVIGVKVGSVNKVYDWNELKNKRLIEDKIGDVPIAIVLSTDGQSFAAFERPSETENFELHNDTLHLQSGLYDFSGRSLTGSSQRLTRINAYQEFWHSWHAFHPDTQKFQ
jgi:hypothetical protein